MKTRCSWYAAAPSYVTLVVGDQEMLREEGPPYEAARGAAGPFLAFLQLMLLILLTFNFLKPSFSCLKDPTKKALSLR
jgi:hypothetical protein